MVLDERHTAVEEEEEEPPFNPSQWQPGDFRPKIRGDDFDVRAGVPGPTSAGPPPPGSTHGYECNRREYVPAMPESTRKAKRLLTPSYPRTGIPIGYQGYVPGKDDTYGATYGFQMGLQCPERVQNLRESNENKPRWSTTNKSFEEDRHDARAGASNLKITDN